MDIWCSCVNSSACSAAITDSTEGIARYRRVGAGGLGQQAGQCQVGIGIDGDGRHAERHRQVRSVHANCGVGGGGTAASCVSRMRGTTACGAAAAMASALDIRLASPR